MPLEPSVDTVTRPSVKRTMMAARLDGRIYQIDFSENPQLDDPTLVDWDISISKIILGKFQFTRTRAVTLDELEFENIVRSGQFPGDSTTDLEVAVFQSLDGKNPEPAVTALYTANELGGLLHMNTRLTGQNFSVQLRGVYNLNTLIFTTHNNGRR